VHDAINFVRRDADAHGLGGRVEHLAPHAAGVPQARRVVRFFQFGGTVHANVVVRGAIALFAVADAAGVVGVVGFANCYGNGAAGREQTGAERAGKVVRMCPLGQTCSDVGGCRGSARDAVARGCSAVCCCGSSASNVIGS